MLELELASIRNYAAREAFSTRELALDKTT